MRYYIKFKLNQTEKQRLREAIETGSLAKGKIFYEEMQTAFKTRNDRWKWYSSFCWNLLLSGRRLIPYGYGDSNLKGYFDNIVEEKDAHLLGQCTMGCEFCNCTRSLKLLGKPLTDELYWRKRSAMLSCHVCINLKCV